MSTVFWTKVACHRLRRHIQWRLRPLPWATRHGDPSDFPSIVASRTSPLRRAPDGAIAAYTEEKTHNLRLACARLNRLVVAPGDTKNFEVVKAK